MKPEDSIMSKIIVPNMGEITEKAHDEQSHRSLALTTKREIPKLPKKSQKTTDEICVINRILSKKMKHKTSKQNTAHNSTGYIKVFDKSVNK